MRTVLVASATVLLLAAGVPPIPAAGSHPVSVSVEDPHLVPGTTTELRTNLSAGTEIELTATGVQPSTLEELVEGASETDEGVRVRVRENGSVPLRFPRRFRCDPGGGRYEFTVREVETNRTGSAAVQVALRAVEYTRFDESYQVVEPNGTADIGFRFGCEDAAVTIEFATDAYRANVTVNRTSDVRFVDALLRYDPDADPQFVGGDNATVTEVSVAGNDSSFAVGERYDLSIYDASSDESDVARLEVVAETPTPTANPSPTRTPSPTASPSQTPTRTQTPTESQTAMVDTETPTVETQSVESTPTAPSGPGFTFVSVVAAAFALLLLERRR